MTRKILGALSLILILMLCLVSCGESEPPAPPPTASLPASETDLFGELYIKGNDNMVPLVTALAQAFEALHPEVSITVSGGGTEQGFAAVINRTVQIAMAKREMTPIEASQCRALEGNPIRHVIARNGVAVTVNRLNPITTISQPDLAEIFRDGGLITNWSALGGQNLPIHIYLYENDSGLSDFFRARILADQAFRSTVEYVSDPETLFRRIDEDPASIGLSRYGYLPPSGINLFEIGAGEFFSPANVTTILSGRYPLTQALCFYTNGESGGLTRSFIQFVQGPSGQEILLKFGLIPAVN